MRHLDTQLASFSRELIEAVGLTDSETRKVASQTAADVRFLPRDEKEKIKASSPVPIRARIEEIAAFQAWMDFAHQAPRNPAVTRAQVITQNYVCLLYLKDALFELLLNSVAQGSVAHRCLGYLTTGKIRKFRNAIAHGNWCYKSDFSGLDAWALKNARDPSQGYSKYSVSQAELNFWQTLSRGVAYASYLQLES